MYAILYIMSDAFIETDTTIGVTHDHGIQPEENGEVTMQMADFIATVFEEKFQSSTFEAVPFKMQYSITPPPLTIEG